MCSFTNVSSCSWTVGKEITELQTGDMAEKKEPKEDATQAVSGAYVISEPTVPDGSWNILSYHSISYFCGYSFYYQAYDGVRLILVSASTLWNETVYWASSQDDVTEWTLEEVPAGDIPISTTPQDLAFIMETTAGTHANSFVAVDELSLYFCLPCDFSFLTNRKIV